MIVVKRAKANKFAAGRLEPQILPNDVLYSDGLANHFKSIPIGAHKYLDSTPMPMTTNLGRPAAPSYPVPDIISVYIIWL